MTFYQKGFSAVTEWNRECGPDAKGASSMVPKHRGVDVLVISVAMKRTFSETEAYNYKWSSLPDLAPTEMMLRKKTSFSWIFSMKANPVRGSLSVTQTYVLNVLLNKNLMPMELVISIGKRISYRLVFQFELEGEGVVILPIAISDLWYLLLSCESCRVGCRLNCERKC